MKNIYKLFILTVLFASLSSCIQEDFVYKATTTPDTGKYNGTAWDFIDKAPVIDSLTLIKEAIVRADLTTMYSRVDIRTFVIPRNPALRKYMKSKGYATMSAFPIPELTSILKYHIVKGYYYSVNPEFMDSDFPIRYETEDGVNPLFFSHDGNWRVLVNQGTKKVFTIYISNIRPTNGVIHISSDIVYYQP